MFLFLKEPAWQRYREELGVQRAVAYLAERGFPNRWPEEVPDPMESGTVFLSKGKPYNPSKCPYYDGYYLCGGIGGVSCSAAGEIIPGIAWHTVCRNSFEECPFYKNKETQ